MFFSSVSLSYMRSFDKHRLCARKKLMSQLAIILRILYFEIFDIAIVYLLKSI